MPTKNPRVNVTFEESTVRILTKLAQKRNTSVANLTKELVLQALELNEDVALSALAERRDTSKAQELAHEDAWE